MKNHSEAESVVGGLIEAGEAFSRLNAAPERRRHEVIVIGGGQAGLVTGYHLQQRGVDFVILDASARVGDAWRRRWDTLRLFTPARYNALDGMAFPGPQHAFPSKDEMADYLEAYAAKFALPIVHGVKVERLSREGDRYVVESAGMVYEAAHVVVAMASYQGRRVPAFAKELAAEITQLHAVEYKNLAQLAPGAVLVVGAANSGGEIAIETVTRHKTWLAGRDPGQVPFDMTGWPARFLIAPILFKLIFHRLLSVKTPLGRMVRRKLLTVGGGSPRIRQRKKDLVGAGVEMVPRVAGVKDGKPVLADGTVLDVANVIWCTGFDNGLEWIDRPIFAENGEPLQTSGLVEGEPGLYFVGQHFQHSFSSTMIHGVSRDARMVVGEISRRRIRAR